MDLKTLSLDSLYELALKIIIWYQSFLFKALLN